MSRIFDFSEEVKRTTAQRVNYICSNPDCRCFTAGPNLVSNKNTKIGDCAHIYSGAEKGPRYEEKLDDKFLKSEGNAIWLCNNCHRKIDQNWQKYPSEELIKWKKENEQEVENFIESNTSPLKLFEDFKKYFPKNENDITDVDYNLLFAFFNEKFKPLKITNETDVELSYYLIFTKFAHKLTIPNQFILYDVLSQIYVNLNLIEKAKDALIKTIETGYDTEKIIINECLYNIITNEKEKAKELCEKFKDDLENYYFIKALLIDSEKDLKDLVKAIYTKKIYSINICVNIAMKANSNAYYNIGREFVYRILEDTINFPVIALKIARILLESVIRKPDFNENILLLNERRDLEVCEEVFEKNLEDFTIPSEAMSNDLYALSIVKFLLQKYDNTIEILNKINDTKLNNKANFLLARTYYRKNDFNKALCEIDKLLQKNKNEKDYKKYRCLIYIKLNENNKALSEIDDYIEEFGEDIQLLLSRAEIITKTEGRSESEKYLNKQFVKSNNIIFLIQNVFINKFENDENDLTQYYYENFHGKLKELSYSQLCQLGNFYYDQKIFEISEMLFKEAFSNNMGIYFIERYVRSLIHNENSIKALEILENVRTNLDIFELTHIEVEIKENIGDDNTVEIAKQYYNKIHDNPSTLLYSMVLIKRSDKSKGREVLSEITNYYELHPVNFEIYCRCLMELDQFQEVVIKTYDYFKKNSSKEDVYNLFLKIFFCVSNIPALKEFFDRYNSIVIKDCGIALIDEDNVRTIIYIVDSNDLSNNEYSVDSDWGKILSGKQKNDRFVRKEGGIEREYTIITIAHKFIIKGNDILFTAHRKVSNPIAIPIKVNLDAQDIKTFLGKGFEILEKDYKYENKILELYKERIVTLGILSNLTDKDLIKTVCFLIFNNEIEFYASTGNVNDFYSANDFVNNINNCILDITSCVLIEKFHLWELLKRRFNMIYIAKSTIEEIDKSLSDDTKNIGKLEGSLQYSNGNAIMIPMNDNQKKDWEDWLKRLKRNICDNCETLKETKNLNLFPYKQQILTKKIRDKIGISFIDTLALAKAKNLLLFSEDFLLREIAKRSGIYGVWLQPFLDNLLKKHYIDFDEYYYYISEIVKMNYYFTHLNIELLMKSLQMSNYKIDQTVYLYLDWIFKSDMNTINIMGAKLIYLAVKSAPTDCDTYDFCFAVYNKLYNKTENIIDVKNLIKRIYIDSNDVEVFYYLMKVFQEWRKIRLPLSK